MRMRRGFGMNLLFRSRVDVKALLKSHSRCRCAVCAEDITVDVQSLGYRSLRQAVSVFAQFVYLPGDIFSGECTIRIESEKLEGKLITVSGIIRPSPIAGTTKCRRILSSEVFHCSAAHVHMHCREISDNGAGLAVHTGDLQVPNTLEPLGIAAIVVLG